MNEIQSLILREAIFEELDGLTPARRFVERLRPESRDRAV
jgi:hypothetical protein